MSLALDGRWDAHDVVIKIDIFGLNNGFPNILEANRRTAPEFYRRKAEGWADFLNRDRQRRWRGSSKMAAYSPVSLHGTGRGRR